MTLPADSRVTYPLSCTGYLPAKLLKSFSYTAFTPSPLSTSLIPAFTRSPSPRYLSSYPVTFLLTYSPFPFLRTSHTVQREVLLLRTLLLGHQRAGVSQRFVHYLVLSLSLTHPSPSLIHPPRFFSQGRGV
jgi:hypothetical protein